MFQNPEKSRYKVTHSIQKANFYFYISDNTKPNTSLFSCKCGLLNSAFPPYFLTITLLGKHSPSPSQSSCASCLPKKSLVQSGHRRQGSSSEVKRLLYATTNCSIPSITIKIEKNLSFSLRHRNICSSISI